MAGTELDYGYAPPDYFRPPDAWDGQQNWAQREQERGETGPRNSDIEYGWGVLGIVNTQESEQQQQQEQKQEAEPETLIRYYVPPKVPHPPSRTHKHAPQGIELLKTTPYAEEANDDSAVKDLIANPAWQVVRVGEECRVLRPKGAEGPELGPYTMPPGVGGVLVIVEPKKIVPAQRYIKELRARGNRQTCVCLVEKPCRDPVAVARQSQALLSAGADEVLAAGWLSYYVNGMSVGGYKASITGGGMIANPAAGNLSYQAAPQGYGGAELYGPSGMVSIG